MVTQLFLLSLSVFSLLFSCSSLFSSPFLLYSQNLHYNFISPNTLQILSLIATSKNCVFLICNTLFFLVAKTSASAVITCSPHEGDDDVIRIEPELLPVLDKDMIVYESRAKEIETNIEEENYIIEENDGGKELACPTQVSIFIADSDEEEEEEEEAKREDLIENDESGFTERCCLFYNDDNEDQEDDDDDDDVLSAEELNQKFEDFIRRMKKEIRLSEAENHQLGEPQDGRLDVANHSFSSVSFLSWYQRQYFFR
ncbi:hypothetical protein STAS_22967 [Striga asiatica]|uniref:Uncharacterized protein n=1 Tax=Striga asiatica TaxID=4170 RepID=A0A5A7QLJ8_STRAF|nr:hypothetical protein STAS_22967 [Striga asiatica]